MIDNNHEHSQYTREQSVFFPTYKRIELEVDRAEGTKIYDTSGRIFTDFLSGIAVNALGNCHPKILRAIDEQSRKYLHLSNSFLQEPQIKLAEMLVARTGYKRVFFTNSGAEAMDASMKLARLWGNSRGKTEIIGFTGGFHGRTYSALSVMDKPLYKTGMEPFLTGTHVIRFNDVEQLRATVNETTCAVILEFLQGEGGIVFATEDFVREINELRQKYDFLIIADEVQAGVGRTGTFFAFEHFQVQPDIVMMAKGIGGGLPLGAVLGGERVENLWKQGMHGSTYGGSPLACATGIVVMEEIENHGLMEHVREIGTYLKSKLQQVCDEFPDLVREVRGKGLMVGLHLSVPSAPFREMLIEEGIIANATAETVIRLVPPLIIVRDDVDELVRALRAVFGKYTARMSTKS